MDKYKLLRDLIQMSDAEFIREVEKKSRIADRNLDKMRQKAMEMSDAELIMAMHAEHIKKRQEKEDAEKRAKEERDKRFCDEYRKLFER